MCFNMETSMVSYLTGTIFSGLILNKGLNEQNKNFIMTGIFCIVICLMQLNEYFIWKNQKCDENNSFWSIMIIVILLLQVLILYICVKKYNSNKITILAEIITLIFLLITIYSLFILVKNRESLCSKPIKNHCRLEWASFKYLYENHKVSGIIFVITYLLSILLLGKGITIESDSYLINNFIKIALILSVLISIYLEKVDFFNIFGSIWCLLSAFFPFLYYLNLISSGNF